MKRCQPRTAVRERRRRAGHRLRDVVELQVDEDIVTIAREADGEVTPAARPELEAHLEEADAAGEIADERFRLFHGGDIEGQDDAPTRLLPTGGRMMGDLTQRHVASCGLYPTPMSWRSPPMMPPPIDPASVVQPTDAVARLALGNDLPCYLVP